MIPRNVQSPSSAPPKPVASVWRPELTHLPEYTWGRKLARRILWRLARRIIQARLQLSVYGLEHFPRRGPGLIVFNHLGDADVVVILSQLPTHDVDPLASSHLYDIPALRWVAQAYGVIWLHRGRPDRRALTCALESLRSGRFVILAPEGRESPLGALEEGLHGAAFLALRAGVPVIPIAVTGTENNRIYAHLWRGPRLPVTMTIGRPFLLSPSGDRRADLERGTDCIMRQLAQLLPLDYRGLYRDQG